jgi:exo-1,4-beta-D-glucosaminidase
VAFFTRLRLLAAEQEVLPVFWSDNFVSLLPGEKLALEAQVPRAELAGGELSLELSGYNSDRSRIKLT